MKTQFTIKKVSGWCNDIRTKSKVWYEISRLFMKEHPYLSATLALSLLILLMSLSIPSEGKILPIQPQVVEAYSLLSKTESGRDLIQRVKKSTKGSFIYLSLGCTEKDRLVSIYGDTVRGVTRSTFVYYNRIRFPRSVSVIINRDLVGTAPRDIIRSIAFELENVAFSFENPQVDFPIDSPLARITQMRVMRELEM